VGIGVMASVILLTTACDADAKNADLAPRRAALVHRGMDYRESPSLRMPMDSQTSTWTITDSGKIYAVTGPLRRDSDRGLRTLVEVDAHRGPHVVARSTFRHGDIDSIASLGRRWVAWTDKSGVQRESMATVRWRVWAMRTRQGAKPVLLATSRRRADRFTPIVRGGMGGIAWALDSRGLSDLWLWRPGDDPVRVAHHAAVDWSTIVTERRRVVYGGPGSSGRTDRADCWQLSLATGKAAPLTHNGYVMSCAANRSHVVFAAHIPPHYKPVPSDGYLDDPFTLWLRTGQSRAQRVHRGYFGNAGPFAAAHALVWDSNAGKGIVYEPYGGGHPRSLGAPAVHWDAKASDHWIAVFMTSASKAGSKIRMYRERRPAN